MQVAAAPGALSVPKTYPTPGVRGSGLECQAAAAQEWLRQATSCPRPGVVAEPRGGVQEEQPHVQGVVAVQAQEGLEEPSHTESQNGRRKEIPLIQDKEQRLYFPGAAVKTYPTPKVRETQVRW